MSCPVVGANGAALSADPAALAGRVADALAPDDAHRASALLRTIDAELLLRCDGPLRALNSCQAAVAAGDSGGRKHCLVESKCLLGCDAASAKRSKLVNGACLESGRATATTAAGKKHARPQSVHAQFFSCLDEFNAKDNKDSDKAKAKATPCVDGLERFVRCASEALANAV